MDIDKTYRVGDKVICGGYLYRIFKVDSEEAVIFFRPYFKENKNSSTVRKIPVQNLAMTNMREPATTEEAKEILTLLSDSKSTKFFADLNEAKEILVQNSLVGTVHVIKWLWTDKQDEEKGLTLSKKRVWDMASERLIEEIAYVHDVSLEEAESIILKHLKSSITS